MTISTTERDGVTVLALDGDVMGGPDGTALHNRLSDLRAEGVQHVVVDLTGVRLMNSSGLGMLIGGLTTMKNGGGDLRLAGASVNLRKLFTMTRLDKVFRQYETAADAVASFGEE
ncbi:MAG: STAS domain-containing protein [Bacteroidota bacterium]